MLIRRLMWLAAFVAASGGLLVVRASQLHQGPLYPDGYQYLLMARGIVEHGRPLLRLGAGGDRFVPNADASLKPLFPALVAGAHLLGLGWLTAARILSALAAAATVALCAVVAHRLTRSWLGGVVGGGLCLASPALAYWSGFAGPDALAPALALAATLALLERRFALGGMLVAGSITTRPEYLALAIAAAVAATAWPAARPGLTRATTAAFLTLASILALVRPPLVAPAGKIVLVGIVASLAAGSLVVLVVRRLLSPAVWGAAVAAAVGTFAFSGVPPGLRDLLGSDWPVFAAAAIGFTLALTKQPSRRNAIAIALAIVLLGAIYLAKNPELERYLTQLVPPLALLASLGAVELGTRRSAAALITGVVAAMVVFLPARPEPGTDAFAAVAPRLARTTGPLVTAAPDAYGFLLYPRAVRTMRPRARGLIVLDAAQRTFEPELTARGRRIARIAGGDGFVRPDGRVDRGPAVVVQGTVWRRP
jgi:hypothetical protein